MEFLIALLVQLFKNIMEFAPIISENVANHDVADLEGIIPESSFRIEPG